MRTVLDWYDAGEDVDRKMPLLSTFLGHADPASTYWYLQAVPELLAVISSRLEQLPGVLVVSALAPALQAFFTERLITQRNASPHTIAAYRDTFRLLLRFAQDQTGKQPFQLDLDDLDAPLIGAFLTHLEHDPRQQPPHPQRQARGDPLVLPVRGARTPRTRAHHRAGHGDPDQTPPAQHRQLPRHRARSQALLAAPDRRTWLGRRDHALLVLMIQTGIRVSELTGLRIGDVHLGVGAHIRVTGKGRKMRSPTLTHETVAVIRAWLTELRGGQPDQPLFPTRQGRPLSRYTVGAIITRHVTTAAVTCTTLPAKRITPHTLRHTNAMLLRANRRRHRDDRAVARPRDDPNHAHLRARRPRPQGTSNRTNRPTRSQAGQIPTHPTNSSRSSKRCDYVEHLICQTLRCKGNRSRQVSIQHNRAWDIQRDCKFFGVTPEEEGDTCD